MQKQSFTTNTIELKDNRIDCALVDAPNWMLQVGSFLVLGIVTLICIIFSTIQYPDIIEIPITAKDIDCNDKITVKLPYSASLVHHVCKGKVVKVDFTDTRMAKLKLLDAIIIKSEYDIKEQSITIDLIVQDNSKYSNILINDFNLKGSILLTVNDKTLLERFFYNIQNQ